MGIEVAIARTDGKGNREKVRIKVTPRFVESRNFICFPIVEFHSIWGILESLGI